MRNNLSYLLRIALLTALAGCSSASREDGESSRGDPIDSLRPQMLGFTTEGRTNSEPASSSPAAPKVFVYDDRRSELTEIFDFRRHLLVIGGDELRRSPGTAESEFSGPLDSCDSAQFFCLETGLHIAVPRNRIAQSWSLDGLSCEARPASGEEESLVSIVCRVDGRDALVRFLYSEARGVISYSRVCPQCRPEEFVLVGDTGMFAQAP